MRDTNGPADELKDVPSERVKENKSEGSLVEASNYTYNYIVNVIYTTLLLPHAKQLLDRLFSPNRANAR